MATVTGTTGNDTLLGTADADTIAGLAGNDSLTGLGGADSITGGDGADVLAGGDGDDTLIGDSGFDFVDYRGTSGPVTVDLSALSGTGEGNDTLRAIEGVYGSAFDDRLTGDDNNNWFMGNGGVDTIDGGGGNDAIDYVFSTGAVTVNLANGVITAPDGADVITGIEYAAGSNFADRLTGDDGDNLLRGRGGNDTLDGGAGFDSADYANGTSSGVTVDLAAGTAVGGAGMDTLVSIEAATGTPFGDTLIGDGAANRLTGGAGGDLLRGAGGNDTLDGGTNTPGFEMDQADYTDASGPVVGFTDQGATPGSASGVGIGIDVLIEIEGFVGSAFGDHFTGSGDDDFFDGRGGDDTFVGGAGFDYVSYRTSAAPILVDLALPSRQIQDGTGGVDTLIEIEVIIGSPLADRMIGGSGNDFFRPGPGDDSLTGGDGDDTLDYNNASGGVTADLQAGTAEGADGNDVFSGFEILQGGAFGDRLLAAPAGSSLRGRAGNDTLIGGTGADRLRGDAGDDLIDGGDNRLWFDLDLANYAAATTAIQANLSTGTATGDGSDTLIGVEGVLGGSGADSLVGSARILEFFRGGAGDDTIDGGDGLDIADYSLTSGPVDIDLARARDQATGADGTDQLAGIEIVRGSAFDDRLVGNDGDNLFRGNGGNDTIRGGGGEDAVDYDSAPGAVSVDLVAGTSGGAGGVDVFDGIENVYGSPHDDTILGDDADNTLRGNEGNDTIDGRGGSDTASYLVATGAVTVDLRTGSASGAEGSDTLIDIENLLGGSFGDTLIGNDAANRLSGDDTEFGAAGDDTLTGHGGADTLTGAGGDDLLDGGSGMATERDLAVYSGPIAGYTLARTGPTLTIADGTPGRDGTDTTVNLERLLFSDMGVNLTVQATAASIAPSDLDRICELYLGFFARVPAADGLENWVNQFKNGKSLNTIADDFYGIGSSEALRSVTGYWDFANDRALSDTDFVRIAYRNVLGREGLENGINYWAGQLTGPGAKTRGELVGTMLDAARGLTGDATWGWVADLLDDKVRMSKRVAVDWGLNYGATPSESIAKGVAIASSVDESPNPNPAYAASPIKTFDFDVATVLIGVNPASIDLIA